MGADAGRGSAREAGRRRRAVWLGLCVLLPLASVAQAQSVVDVLKRQRRDARLAEVLAEIGPHVPPRPIMALGRPDPHVAAFEAAVARREAARDSLVRADSIAADRNLLEARLAAARWRKVQPETQGAFVDQYREVYWQAAPVARLAIDTLETPELRGRLQAAFGDPTRNADAQRRHGYGGSEFVQFEYWFVVNDSIPLLALDLDGPFGRGLLIAGDERHAELLPALRADLSDRLESARRPDPYIDYYRSYERDQWYRTGYNGADFFTVPVRAPRWSGRTEGDRWIIHR